MELEGEEGVEPWKQVRKLDLSLREVEDEVADECPLHGSMGKACVERPLHGSMGKACVGAVSLPLRDRQEAAPTSPGEAGARLAG